MQLVEFVLSSRELVFVSVLTVAALAPSGAEKDTRAHFRIWVRVGMAGALLGKSMGGLGKACGDREAVAFSGPLRVVQWRTI